MTPQKVQSPGTVNMLPYMVNSQANIINLRILRLGVGHHRCPYKKEAEEDLTTERRKCEDRGRD